MLTADRLRQLIRYDQQTGAFTWLVDRGGTARRGTVAGSIHTSNGTKYWRIRVDNKAYYGHQLACLYVTGEIPAEVDHKDLDGLNNRWDNLRPADRSKNMGNGKRRSTNTSGFKGVTLHKNRWRAQITRNRQNYTLGEYDTPEEAHAVYCAAARRLYGEFARAG